MIRWRYGGLFFCFFIFLFGALALRAVAVCWQCSTLKSPPEGADYVNIPPGLSCCRPLSLQQRNTFYQRIWNDVFFVCVEIFTVTFSSVARFSCSFSRFMYKWFNSLKDMYKDECNVHATAFPSAGEVLNSSSKRGRKEG